MNSDEEVFPQNLPKVRIFQAAEKVFLFLCKKRRPHRDWNVMSKSVTESSEKIKLDD